MQRVDDCERSESILFAQDEMSKFSRISIGKIGGILPTAFTLTELRSSQDGYHALNSRSLMLRLTKRLRSRKSQAHLQSGVTHTLKTLMKTIMS